jgi:hypothetical protein
MPKLREQGWIWVYEVKSFGIQLQKSCCIFTVDHNLYFIDCLLTVVENLKYLMTWFLLISLLPLVDTDNWRNLRGICMDVDHQHHIVSLAEYCRCTLFEFECVFDKVIIFLKTRNTTIYNIHKSFFTHLKNASIL